MGARSPVAGAQGGWVRQSQRGAPPRRGEARMWRGPGCPQRRARGQSALPPDGNIDHGQPRRQTAA